MVQALPHIVRGKDLHSIQAMFNKLVKWQPDLLSAANIQVKHGLSSYQLHTRRNASLSRLRIMNVGCSEPAACSRHRL